MWNVEMIGVLVVCDGLTRPEVDMIHVLFP